MARKLETVWPIEEHTQAKHRILRGYLEAWLPIMSSRNERLVIVDGFAGPGVYKGGEPGSPIITLQAFLEHEYRDRITAELIYIFIDEDAKRVARLKQEVARLGKLPSQAKVHVIHGAYENVFSQALDDVEKKGSALAPTFAFVDPFGYAQASMHLAGRFLQFDRCEVLIYVPLPFINRFVGRAGQEAALTSLFGTDEWKKALALQGRQRLRFLHDLFRRQLIKEVGLTYVQSFEIITSAPNSGYHLFFGTRHERGLERMKETMWKIDPAEGHRFRDSTLVGQTPLFQPQVDTRPLRDELAAHFGSRRFTIQEALSFTLIETPYIPSHVKKLTLKPLEQADKLAVVSAKPGRKRGTYPDGTVLRFKP